MEFTAQSELETDIVGQKIFGILPSQCVVALIGTLGAGKTRLIQAIAKAAGIDPAGVSSPTYVLIHEYQGTVPIHHFDVYRLNNVNEFLQLGAEEYFERPGLSLIEWGDRVESVLPREHYTIHIEILGENSRKFVLEKNGSQTSCWYSNCKQPIVF